MVPVKKIKKNMVIKQYHISKSFVVLNISIIINNSTIESVIQIILNGKLNKLMFSNLHFTHNISSLSIVAPPSKIFANKAKTYSFLPRCISVFV